MLSGTYGIARTAKLVNVNVEQILASINHELLQVGAWLNIIGYVKRPEATAATPPAKPGKQMRRSRRLKSIVVDAIMIWSAGAIRLDDYNYAVHSYQKALPPG